MRDTFLTSIIATGFTVAFLHAAIPTHWLPFVAASRGQGWSRAKTLAVTAGAGLGHTLFTALLGALVVWLGIETSRWTGGVFPYIAGALLILVGLYYLRRQWRGGHGHHHALGRDHQNHRSHDHAHDQAVHDDHRHHRQDAPARVVRARSDRAVIVGLLALLTFSPCEGFLPVYLTGVRYGWAGFALLSVVLALATVTGMVIFTWLTLTGLERLKLEAVERVESGILGAVLCTLGLAVMVFE